MARLMRRFKAEVPNWLTQKVSPSQVARALSDYGEVHGAGLQFYRAAPTIDLHIDTVGVAAASAEPKTQAFPATRRSALRPGSVRDPFAAVTGGSTFYSRAQNGALELTVDARVAGDGEADLGFLTQGLDEALRWLYLSTTVLPATETQDCHGNDGRLFERVNFACPSEEVLELDLEPEVATQLPAGNAATHGIRAACEAAATHGSGESWPLSKSPPDPTQGVTATRTGRRLRVQSTNLPAGRVVDVVRIFLSYRRTTAPTGRMLDQRRLVDWWRLWLALAVLAWTIIVWMLPGKRWTLVVLLAPPLLAGIYEVVFRERRARRHGRRLYGTDAAAAVFVIIVFATLFTLLGTAHGHHYIAAPSGKPVLGNYLIMSLGVGVTAGVLNGAITSATASFVAYVEMLFFFSVVAHATWRYVQDAQHLFESARLWFSHRRDDG